MALRRTCALAVAATAITGTLALVVEAGAAPQPADDANAVCRSLREAVVADIAPPAPGRRLPTPQELERTARAFLPLGRQAHDRLVRIATAADDPELTALVDAYGGALGRLADLAAAGTLGTLHQDAALRQGLVTTNARALRAGTLDCVL